MTNIKQFILDGVHSVVLDAAVKAATEMELSPDEATGVPLAFLSLDMRLQSAVDAAIVKWAEEMGA